jgi:hypothetical protein
MRIGIDFDNTIVCYDAVFHRVALSEGLIPADLPVNKRAIRNYLRECDLEDRWTEFQGLVYGTLMADVEPFPGCLKFFTACRDRGIETCIVSHKTRTPYVGLPHDLHEAAWGWLRQHGLDGTGHDGGGHRVFFELTIEEKIERIVALECDYFVDDLPEFLTLSEFPGSVQRILFDPNGLYDDLPGIERSGSWDEIEKLLLCQ